HATRPETECLFLKKDTNGNDITSDKAYELIVNEEKLASDWGNEELKELFLKLEIPYYTPRKENIEKIIKEIEDKGISVEGLYDYFLAMVKI
ncbi:unnamed protein product, partial [marine sediment metagenome]